MKYLFIIKFLLSIFIQSTAYGQTQEKSTRFTIKSNFSFTDTENKLKKILSEKNISIFAEIDHTKKAENIGQKLPSIKVFIVGNPKTGTPIMQENPQAAIELPLKIMIYDDDKNTWISYKTITNLTTLYSVDKNKNRLKSIDENMINMIKSISQ